MAFTRVAELYNARLHRVRSGTASTLGLFQNTAERLCGGGGDAQANHSPGDTSPRPEAAPAESLPTGRTSLVRTTVKLQTDLAYYFEELTALAHRVRRSG